MNSSSLCRARGMDQRRSIEPERVLRSTYHEGRFIGRWQVRMFLCVAITVAMVRGWVEKLPAFTGLSVEGGYHCNVNESLLIKNDNLTEKCHFYQDEFLNSTAPCSQFVYNFPRDFSVISSYDLVCDKEDVYEHTRITFIVGEVVGCTLMGIVADMIGRKLVFFGSIWSLMAMALFQCLGEDHVSYGFFNLFQGIFIGGAVNIGIVLVLELFTRERRSLFGVLVLPLSAFTSVTTPWISYVIHDWKYTQAALSATLLFTFPMFWLVGESIGYLVCKGERLEIYDILLRMGKVNGISAMSKRYPYVNKKQVEALKREKYKQEMAPLLQRDDENQAEINRRKKEEEKEKERGTCCRSIKNKIEIMKGEKYHRNKLEYHVVEMFFSPQLAVYFFVWICLWAAAGVAESALTAVWDEEVKDIYMESFTRYLVEIPAFLIVIPVALRCGRRFPLSISLILGAIFVMLSVLQLPATSSKAVFWTFNIGGIFFLKIAFALLVVSTAETFPTSIRCSLYGMCTSFYYGGVLMADQFTGNLNARIPRLVYGGLLLVIVLLVFLLPETKVHELPMTMKDVEELPGKIAKKRSRNSRIQVERESSTDSDTPPPQKAGLSVTLRAPNSPSHSSDSSRGSPKPFHSEDSSFVTSAV